jgi:hypothetical protein
MAIFNTITGTRVRWTYHGTTDVEIVGRTTVHAAWYLRGAHDYRDSREGGDAGAGARAAHMLERIVVEIRSTDLAVEEEPQ